MLSASAEAIRRYAPGLSAKPFRARAYYPPYHGKYNAIERCWGILELHWNGALLDSLDAVLG
jgi:transposase